MRIILLFLLAIACTGQDLVVKQADNLLEYQIEKRLPLYSEQKKELAKDIQNFLHSEKPAAQKMLPVIDELNAGLDNVATDYRAMANFYEATVAHFSVIIAKHMSKLDKNQQRLFFKTLGSENAELEKKEPAHRMDKVRARFKMFFGTLSEDQRKLLEEWTPYFEALHQERLKRRKVMHEEFRETYGLGLSPASAQEKFLESMRKYHLALNNHDKNIELIKSIVPGLAPNQKAHFAKKLVGIKEMLQLYLETDY